jgi:carbamoyl-phosphate synthase large subunit
VSLLRAFKKSMQGQGRLIAGDCNPLAPALYEADAHYVLPRIDAPEYLDVLLGICRKEQISGVLTLIDPEIAFLAANADAFARIGVTALVSSKEAALMSFDKMQMHDFCVENGFRTVATYAELEAAEKALEEGRLSFPLFAKPLCGSCSYMARRVEDLEHLRFLCGRYPQTIVQEFMPGNEIGADVYVDGVSGEVVSVFTKRKLLMRSGETDKAVSFRDPRLFALICDFVKKANYRYQLDIDLFERDGEYYISEVNPRFGGGYPLAFECGCDFPALILNNLRGIANAPQVGEYPDGVRMMKYPEVKFLR